MTDTNTLYVGTLFRMFRFKTILIPVNPKRLDEFTDFADIGDDPAPYVKSFYSFLFNFTILAVLMIVLFLMSLIGQVLIVKIKKVMLDFLHTVFHCEL